MTDTAVAIGAGLMVVGIVLFFVGLVFDRDSRTRWRMNWWAIVFLYFGVTSFLTGELLDTRS